MPQLTTYGVKVPVTVVTGFLGSGKSTLVNYLLSQRGDKNICVIENEFGEVNIDKTLVADQLAEREDLVSVENGCVCCSLRKDIVKAFSELQRRSKSRDKPMDHILLETTGLADPSPVAFTFFANPWIAANFQLDSIMCIVDAKHLMQHLLDGQHAAEGAINEAVQQIAFSDLILLNKVDLVSESDKADVLEAIRTINNTARIIECSLNSETGRPPLDEVLGTNTFSVQRALEVDPEFLETDTDIPVSLVVAGLEGAGHPGLQHLYSRSTSELETTPRAGAQDSTAQGPGTAATGDAATSAQGPGTEAGDSAPASAQGPGTPTGAEDADQIQGDTAGEAGHKRELAPGAWDSNTGALEQNPKRRRKKLHDLSDVSSVGITSKGQLDEYRFNMFMRDLLAEKAKDIFRCKGILAVHGHPNKKFVFQGVHETICYGPAEQPWAKNEPILNQIVFIGRGLDRKMLGDGFRTCLWVPLPEGWEEAVDPATKKPYFWNRMLSLKSWSRPEGQSQKVHLHHASTQQTSQHVSAQQPQGLLHVSAQQPQGSHHASTQQALAGSSSGGPGAVCVL